MLTLPTMGKWFYMILSGEKGRGIQGNKAVLYKPFQENI